MRLRGKISTEKAELMTSVVLYNKISDGDDVNIEDVTSGVFKWMDESEVVSYSKGLYHYRYYTSIASSLVGCFICPVV